jgi:hypothetical protein
VLLFVAVSMPVRLLLSKCGSVTAVMQAANEHSRGLKPTVTRSLEHSTRDSASFAQHVVFCGKRDSEDEDQLASHAGRGGRRLTLEILPRNGPGATLERREPVASAVGLPPLPRLGRGWGRPAPGLPVTFTPESDDPGRGRQTDLDLVR